LFPSDVGWRLERGIGEGLGFVRSKKKAGSRRWAMVDLGLRRVVLVDEMDGIH